MYELSIEVRDLVQSKVGTTAFSTVWEQLRKRSVEKRGNRKAEQHRLVRTALILLVSNMTLTRLVVAIGRCGSRSIRPTKRTAIKYEAGI